MKTLRTLTDADFTTKGNTLTWEELDQNFIDLWDKVTDGEQNLNINNLGLQGYLEIGKSKTRWPVLANNRTNAPAALTIQPSTGNVVASAELYPSGTDDRSHFVIANSSDFDNNGAIKLELDGAQGSMWAYTKGTGGTKPTHFIFRDFAQGVRFENTVVAGGNISNRGTSILQVTHTGNNTEPLIIGDDSTPASTTGIYMRSTTSGEIRTGDGASILFSPNNTEAGRFTSDGDFEADNNLFVKNGLFAREFIVDVTRNQASVRMSPTPGGKIATITDSTVGSEKVKFEDENGNAITPFSDNDLFRILVRTGNNTRTIIKSIKRRVVADGQPSNVVSLTTSGATTGTDTGTIEVGDQAVHAGNTSNTLRDHYVDFITANVNIPRISVKDEVTDFGTEFEALRFAGLSGFDASITGDIGIAGATKSEGAVFWVTEDEGKIGGFNILSDRIQKDMTSGGYINMRVLSDNRAWFLVTPDGDISGATGSYIAMQSNGGDLDFEARQAGDQLFRLGSIENRIASSYFDATDLWFGNSSKSSANWKMNSAGLQFNTDGAGGFIGLDWADTIRTPMGHIRGSAVTILDDDAEIAVTAISTGGANEHSMFLVWTENDTRMCCVNIMPGNNPQVLFKTGPAVDTGTGVPTGTTSTDGVYGIYISDERPTNPPRIHIENRTGTQRTFHYLNIF